MLETSISFAQNTGIGTISPTAKLDVNGDLRVRSASSTTDATLYNTLLSDDSGNVMNVKTTDFVDALKIPTTIFNAQQNTDVETPLLGLNTFNKTVFGTVNLIKTTAGTWNATTNVFTVAKKGIYQIVAGCLLNEVEVANYVMHIIAGSSLLTVGGIALTGNKYATNGNYVMLLNANDTIYTYTNTGAITPYSQGKAFLYITFTPL
ncbi:hypothetical protein [Pedobacter polaris]|nr:hypothetical protein [Pedobacter polaris]